MPEPQSQKSPKDIAADLLVYMPVGVALEVGKHLPALTKQGRDLLEGPLSSAKMFGKVVVDQGRKDLGERLKHVTEPYFGSSNAPQADTESPAPEAERTATTVPGPDESELAIEGYTSMAVVEIIEHLDRLNQSEIEQIRDFELAHQNRSAVLNRCEELLRSPGA